MGSERVIEEFHSGLHLDRELRKLCAELSLGLDLKKMGLDSEGALYALAGVESSYGTDDAPRIEPAYMPEGRYFNSQLKTLYKKFGGYVCCSYGPWQMMAIRAYELGFEGHPTRLWDGKISGPFVVRNLSGMIEDGAASMEQVLDAYNTGSFRVGEPPQAYIAKFWGCYGKFIEQKREEKGD